MQCASAQAATA